MVNLCIIPARGGSKRIPKKNIRSFLGKPIIAYSINAALNSGLFDEVMVSTDSDEIATIAKQYGAVVPFLRSNTNADDYATTANVLEEVLARYQDKGVFFDNLCCIYPCAPFVNQNKLQDSFHLLKTSNFDAVIPVVPFAFPIQRAFRLQDDKINFFQPEFEEARSQDLEKSYHDVGQFYWMNVAAFKRERRIIMKNSGAIVLSELEAQDIDNESDWKVAELKYKMWRA